MLENPVRPYALINNYDVLDVFYSLENNISESLKELGGMQEENKYDLTLIDSIFEIIAGKTGFVE